MQAGGNTPANHFGGTFGPNEWLVQEMYERYQQDPASVDKAWWDFFADFKGTATSNGSTSNQKGVPPIPKSQQIAQQVTTPAPVVQSAPVVATPRKGSTVEAPGVINVGIGLTTGSAGLNVVVET